MSIVSQLISAFKKGAGQEPDPDKVVYPMSGNGPDLSTADDGHEFRQPPPSVGGKPVEEVAVDDGGTTPVANLNVGSGAKAPIDSRPPVGGNQGPKGPEGPTEPGPGGGDNGPSTPPSAPFDPNKVIFKEAPAGGTGTGDGPRPEVRPAVRDILTSSQGPSVDTDSKLNSGGINPLVVSRDKALGFADTGTEDPDAGGEVALKQNIDPAFTRRLRFNADTDPSVQSSDPEEGGEIAGLRRPPQDFKIADSPVVEDPDAGGEVAGLRRPPGYIGETEKNLDLSSSDPEEGGEVFSEGKFKIETGLHRQVLDNSAASQIRRDPGATSSDDPDTGDEVTGGQRETLGNTFADKMAQGGGTALADDPDAGGEVTGRNLGNVKIEEIKPPAGPGGVPLPYPNADGNDADSLDLSSDGGDGEQIPIKVSFISREAPAASDGDGLESDDDIEALARKAGGGQKDFPYVKLEDVLISGTQGSGDPPDDSDDDGLADALARKAGGGQKDFFKVQMEEVMVTSVQSKGEPGGEDDVPDDETGPEAFLRIRKRPGGEKGAGILDDPLSSGDDGLPDDETGPEAFMRINKGPGPKAFADVESSFISDNDDLSDDDKGSVAGWIARGKGTKKGFSRQEMDDALDPETSADVDGESTTKDHTGELAFARRTEVKDAHDRNADLESPEPKPVNALAADDDDDYESSSLLDLKPASATKEMLPGLAGGLDDAELELDFDDDLDDADESEL